MSFKVAFIGAGSIGFTRRLVGDLLAVPEFHDLEIAFTDIDRGNLDMVTQLCLRDIRENGLKARLTSTLSRREALKNARYVFCTVRVGGLKGLESDVQIPLKYGIDQCVGDTLCAGGIMYAQRGIPVLLDICRDIREVSEPNCLLLNYSNPMAMLTWACHQYGGVRTIGLCHGVQHGHQQIATVLGLKKEEVDIICAGINHQTWYVQVKHQRKDMLPGLLQAFENHLEYRVKEKVRIDMLRRFGYYSTESNGHLSEYVPWYRKDPKRLMDWVDLSRWIHGETAGYLRVCKLNRRNFTQAFPKAMKAPPLLYKSESRSVEHGSFIIEGLETNRVYRGHFNVINQDCITNLPKDAIIEVPGYVDRNGISIPQVGDLPLGCAAVCNASISVQRLSVEAAVHGDDTLLRQAMMMDPLTGAVCTPPEIWKMCDEMLVAMTPWLPQYKKSILEAKKRLKSQARQRIRNPYPKAIRLKTFLQNPTNRVKTGRFKPSQKIAITAEQIHDL